MTTEKDAMTGLHTNPDPITGAPGSHPGATAIGSASGGVTGAVLGAIAGPVGMVIGAVAGAAVGGGLGHAAGEANDPSVTLATTDPDVVVVPTRTTADATSDDQLLL